MLISRATEDEGPLRTTVAKTSPSPVGMRGALQAGVLRLLEEKISIRDAEIFAIGKIAESPKFSGEEDSSLQTAVCLIERSELWMEED